MFHKCNVKWIFVSRNCHIYVRTEICTRRQKYIKQNPIYLYETQYKIIPKYIERNFLNILNQIFQRYISDI